MTAHDFPRQDADTLVRPGLAVSLPWSQLLAVLDHPATSGPAPEAVTGITLDSRQVRPGDLYAALPGTRVHGARFAPAALAAGAAAVLTDAQGRALLEADGVPVVVVPDARVAMAAAAAEIFGHPARSMTMFGITGTNGKTTTAFLVEAGLLAARRRPGTIGTIGFRLDGRSLASARTTVTTPEAPDLQGLFGVMAERGATDVVMEVSSHALALHRVDGTVFDVVAFTNLGRDHLDFHHTLEAYFEAKARLFTPELARAAVVNVDDPRGVELVQRMHRDGRVRVVTTSLEAGSDYRIESWSPDGALGARVTVSTPSGRREFTISLPGLYNVRNAVMALAMLESAGLGFDAVVDGLEHAQVPGRMEQVRLGDGAPGVLVDFAHTPQAISSALAAARTATCGRILTVVGAGGDRDAAKRGPMGLAAAQGSDVVLVTDDNPRTEEPASIRAAVLAGAREVPGVVVEDAGERRAAIGRALELAEPGDVVCILGKGHETGQQVGGQVLPFDDRVVVAREWAERHPDAARDVAGSGDTPESGERS